MATITDPYAAQKAHEQALVDQANAINRVRDDPAYSEIVKAFDRTMTKQQVDWLSQNPNLQPSERSALSRVIPSRNDNVDRTLPSQEQPDNVLRNLMTDLARTDLARTDGASQKALVDVFAASNLLIREARENAVSGPEPISEVVDDLSQQGRYVIDPLQDASKNVGRGLNHVVDAGTDVFHAARRFAPNRGQQVDPPTQIFGASEPTVQIPTITRDEAILTAKRASLIAEGMRSWKSDPDFYAWAKAALHSEDLGKLMAADISLDLGKNTDLAKIIQWRERNSLDIENPVPAKGIDDARIATSWMVADLERDKSTFLTDSWQARVLAAQSKVDLEQTQAIATVEPVTQPLQQVDPQSRRQQGPGFVRNSVGAAGDLASAAGHLGGAAVNGAQAYGQVRVAQARAEAALSSTQGVNPAASAGSRARVADRAGRLIMERVHRVNPKLASHVPAEGRGVMELRRAWQSDPKAFGEALDKVGAELTPAEHRELDQAFGAIDRTLGSDADGRAVVQAARSTVRESFKDAQLDLQQMQERPPAGIDI